MRWADRMLLETVVFTLLSLVLTIVNAVVFP
jgi:hypothetical protein